MNRRSFFGFACGGVVAAPAALIGESAIPSVAVAKNSKPLTITVDVSDNGQLAALVRRVSQDTFAQVANAHKRRYEVRQG